MNMRRILIMALAAVIVGGTVLHAQETDLKTLQNQYDDRVSLIELNTIKQQDVLFSAYTNDLQRVRANVQQSGDLDKLKIVIAEIDRATTEKILPFGGSEVPELKALLAQYQVRLQQIDKGRAQAILNLAQGYDRMLDALQRKLTQEGKVEDASAVQGERRQLPASPIVVGARSIIDSQPVPPVPRREVGAPSSAKPVQEPRPVSSEAVKPVFLSDLKEFDAHVGYGRFGKNGDLGYEGKEIVVDGKPVSKGLSMHPPSHGSSGVSYRLDGKYRWFHAHTSINDTSGGSREPVIFRVHGDGKELWSSSPLQNPGDLEEVRVDIRGVKKLRLEVSCPGLYDSAHAVWVDPRLLK